MTYLIYNVSEYFNRITSIQGKDVIDWGCNHGNFLRGEYHLSSYTGVDVDKTVIDQMRISHPNHNWVHYNCYNWQYSAEYNGDPQWPELPETDLICAFSVLTHMSIANAKAHIDYFYTLLRPAGRIMLTYFDSDDENALDQVLKYREEYFNCVNADEIKEQVLGAKASNLIVNTHSWDVFVLRNMYNVPRFGRETYFLQFFNGEWLAEQTGGKIVDITHNYAPHTILATQKCLVLEKPND